MSNILNADQERILRSEITAKSIVEKQDLQAQLDELIELDLVEYDQSEDAYYLTYEGYNSLEAIDKQILKEKRLASFEVEQAQRVKRYKVSRAIILGIFFLVFLGLSVYAIKTNYEQSQLEKLEQD